MEVGDNVLKSELTKVISSGEKPVFASWSLEFKIKDSFKEDLNLSKRDKQTWTKKETEEKIFSPLKLLNIDIQRDYEKAYGDHIQVTAFIPFGLWAKVLFPAKDHLQCILTRKPKGIKLDESKESLDSDITVAVFDAIAILEQEHIVETSRLNTTDRFYLDNHVEPLVIRFELLDRSLELLRKVTAGGPVRQCTPEQALQGLLGLHTKDLELEGSKVVESISIVKPNNQETREHINIAHHQKLLDIPQYIQENCGGVYTSGINTYFQSSNLYVYPIFDTKRFEKEKKTLTVIKVSESIYVDLEVSYRLESDKLTVLAYSETNFLDITKQNMLNKGTGVRYSDARQYMNRRVQTKDNKSTIKRKKANHEYLTDDLKEQNVVYESIKGIHANPYHEYSQQAAKTGGIYSFVWKHAEASLLYPGMPVRILYADHDNVKELRGVLLKVQVSIQSQLPGIAPCGHTCQAALFILATPYTTEQS